jgi:hypothetical protein
VKNITFLLTLLIIWHIKVASISVPLTFEEVSSQGIVAQLFKKDVMNKYNRVFQRSRFFIIIFAVAIVVYFGGNAWSSNKIQKNVVQVNNRTKTCQVISAEKHNGHVKVTIQNNNDKAITAYVLNSRIDPQTVFTFEEEFATSEGDNVILPGQVYEIVIGIPSSLNRQPEINLNLSAVVFEDKSSEGDENIIRNIEDNRLGEKMQLMKALPVLDKLSRLSDTEIGSYWNKAAKHDLEVALNASDVESLIQMNKKSSSNKKTDIESEAFAAGAKAGKESILREYQELIDIREKEGVSALRERIIRVRDLYAKRVNKF